MSLRQSLLSKLVAAWFIVLIVLPFTAPFQTYDPRAPIGSAPAHDLKTSDKLSNDAAVVALAPLSVTVSRTFAQIYGRAARTNDRRPADLAVLRL
jgi:hypothetical protein